MVKQSIVPAIIPMSYAHLESRLREVRGVVRTVQVDVMDGSYAPTVSWPYMGSDKELFEAQKRDDNGLPYWQDLDLEVDLMVAHPEAHIERWAIAGAARVILHLETMQDPAACITQCIERRLEVALALKPGTSEELLAPHLPRVVFIQCMGSERIGMHGVTLDRTVVDKIGRMHARWPELLIGVDIGVNRETIEPLYRAGARRFAAGSAVFDMGEPVRALRVLNEVVDGCAATV